jgi:hypothetical protein
MSVLAFMEPVASVATAPNSTELGTQRCTLNAIVQLSAGMNWFRVLFGIAIALFGQDAFAKQRLTDPIKIARECKSDIELLCKGLRPGGQRIISCLKEKVTELSPACWGAFKSTE